MRMIPTIRVVHGDGFRVINASDFDPDNMKEFVDAPAKKATPKKKPAARKAPAKKKAE